MYSLTIGYTDKPEKKLYFQTLQDANTAATALFLENIPNIWKIRVEKEN